MLVKVRAGFQFKFFPAEQFLTVDEWRELYYFAFVGTAHDNVYMGVITRHHISLFGSALFYGFVCSFVIPFFFQLGIINKVATGQIFTCPVFSVEVPCVYIHRVPNICFYFCLVIPNVIHFIGMRSNDQAVEPCFTLYTPWTVVIYASDNITTQHTVFVMTEVELLVQSFLLIFLF